LRNHGAKILVSSGTHGDRPEPCECTRDIEDAFAGVAELLLLPHEGDMRAFISQEMHKNSEWETLLSNTGTKWEDIANHVLEDAVGVYHVAELLVQRELRTRKEMALVISQQANPWMSSGEIDVFCRKVTSLKSQTQRRAKIAMLILDWVVSAKRPLKAIELTHAIVLDTSKKTEASIQKTDILICMNFNEDSDDQSTEAVTLTELCAGLVCMTEDTTVTLSENRQLSGAQRRLILPGAPVRITHTCLGILSQDIVLKSNQYPFNAEPKNIEQLSEDMPLLEYCQHYWTEHLAECTESLDEVDEAAMEYLELLYQKPPSRLQERKPRWDKAYQVLVTDEETPVLKIARLGMNRLLEKLIRSRRYDINAESHKRETAFSVAVGEGHVSTARLLYRLGASIHYRNSYGDSLLHTVAKANDEVMTMLLIYCGLDPDSVVSVQHYHTPLYVAASNSSTRVGRVLLQFSKNTQGAMTAAAQRGSLEFVQLLVQHGCKISGPSEGNIAWSPFGEAIRSKSADLVRFMLDNGADPCQQDDCRHTPIHIAAWEPNLDIFKILVAHGADPFAMDDGANDVCEGVCALSNVIGHKDGQKVVEFLLPLLETREVSVEALIAMAKSAARAKTPDITLFNLFLDKIPGPIKDWRKDCNNTLLGSAVSSKSAELLSTLLSRGILENADIQDERGWSSLHLAASRKAHELTEQLLQHGLNHNVHTTSGMQPLHVAAWYGKIENCKLLLSYGAELESRPRDESTPLIAAAFASKHDTAMYLLQAGANPSACNMDGETALHHAVMDDAKELVEELLIGGTTLSVQSWKAGTPLHLAAGKGFVEIARKLLAHDAEIEVAFDYHGGKYEARRELVWRSGLLWNEEGSEMFTRPKKNWITLERGWTPLHTAVASGHIELAELLLDHGANISAKGCAGETPLYVAASACLAPVVEMLLSRGANVRETSNTGNTTLHAIAESAIAKCNIDIADRFKCSCKLRHEAEEAHGHEDHSKSDCIAMMLKHGADMDARNDLGQTPLSLAVQSGTEDVVAILIDRISELPGSFSAQSYLTLLRSCDSKVEANILELVANNCSETDETRVIWSSLLCQAALEGNHSLVALGLAKGGSCPARTDDGLNPFLEAIKKEHADTVKFLLEAGRSPFEIDDRGRSAIHLACHVKEDKKYKSLSIEHRDHSKEFMVKDLYRYGAEMNARANDGNTPLHFAVMTGKIALVKTLVNSGACVDIRNNLGETPFHWALHAWIFPDLVDYLLQKGACPSAQDLKGYTSLHKIRYSGKESERAVELLSKNGADPLIRAYNGDLAIHCAARRGRLSLIQALLRSTKTPMINLKGAWGKTALHIAARKGNWNFIEALLKLGADTGVLDDKSWTPLHYAVRSGNVEATRGLLKYSKGNIKGFSIPLRAAIRNNDEKALNGLANAANDLQCI
jgi:ankyrin repeat protein